MSGSEPQDPIARFEAWYAEATAKEPSDPNAAALATVGPDGRPSARMMLLKGVDARGFAFYTNCESRKGLQLQANLRAALCFHWKSLQRQVRVEGQVEQVTPAEADAYFASRPRAAQIGAWASAQSRPMAGRYELEKRVAQYTAKFGLGKIARPPYWSGFRVVPEMIEFWQGRPFRLHDRMVYHRRDGGWAIERLYP